MKKYLKSLDIKDMQIKTTVSHQDSCYQKESKQAKCGCVHL